jgi:hypothetical protein
VFFDEAQTLFQMPPQATGGIEAALRVPFTQVPESSPPDEPYKSMLDSLQ